MSSVQSELMAVEAMHVVARMQDEKVEGSQHPCTPKKLFVAQIALELGHVIEDARGVSNNWCVARLRIGTRQPGDVAACIALICLLGFATEQIETKLWCCCWCRTPIVYCYCEVLCRFWEYESCSRYESWSQDGTSCI